MKIDLHNFMEKDRHLSIEWYDEFYDQIQSVKHSIPDGVFKFKFDFTDESIPECIPDEDGNIDSNAPLDGRVYYRFYLKSGNGELLEIYPLDY